jgi:hypothetical protein
LCRALDAEWKLSQEKEKITLNDLSRGHSITISKMPSKRSLTVTTKRSVISIHTKILLELVPTLKKAIYWDQKVVDGLTLIKKNSVPFADETSDHEGEVDEEGDRDGPEPFVELTSPSPLRKAALHRSIASRTNLQVPLLDYSQISFPSYHQFHDNPSSLSQHPTLRTN